MNFYKKMVATIIVAAMIISMFLLPASAALTPVEISKGTDYWRWDPVSVQVKVQNDYDYFRMVSYITFDKDNVNTAIDTVQDLYYVLEHLNLKDNGTATLDDLYSNFPYAKYDLDDDGFLSGNGYQEELEVACFSSGNPTPFIAGAYYFFDSTWHNPSSASVNMQGSIRSQKSMWSPIFQEMQAHETEYHGDTAEFKVAGKSRANLNTEITTSQVSIPKEEEPILVMQAFENELERYDTMVNQYSDVMRQSRGNAEAETMLKNANAVVTFNAPLSRDEVLSITNETGAEIKSCVLKYIDGQGLRITGWTDDLSEENLQRKLNYLREMHDNVEYCGVVSAEIVVDTTTEAYRNMLENENVYFSDLSDPIIRIENEDYDRSLDIQVMDLSWNLEPNA